jgi:hypothetical protein
MANPVIISGLVAPDSSLAQAACELVKGLHPPVLLNHVHRAWWFADLIGKKRNLRYDRELVYIAALLHDLGLTPEHETDKRFEIDSANAATQFLARRAYPPEKVALAWDAIALHTSTGIADQKQPEVALVHFGAAADVLGLNLQELTPSAVEEVLEHYPRLGMKQALIETLAGLLKRKPHTAFGTVFTDVGTRHVHGFNCPNFCDLIEQAPFLD